MVASHTRVVDGSTPLQHVGSNAARVGIWWYSLKGRLTVRGWKDTRNGDEGTRSMGGYFNAYRSTNEERPIKNVFKPIKIMSKINYRRGGGWCLNWGIRPYASCLWPNFCFLFSCTVYNRGARVRKFLLRRWWYENYYFNEHLVQGLSYSRMQKKTNGAQEHMLNFGGELLKFEVSLTRNLCSLEELPTVSLWSIYIYIYINSLSHTFSQLWL